MTKKDLSVKEIVSIIKVCRDSGVSVLKFRDLHLEIGVNTPIDVTAPIPTTKAIVEKQEEQAKIGLLQDEQKAKAERLAIMMLEDPYGYEQLMASGEIGDGEEYTEA